MKKAILGTAVTAILIGFSGGAFAADEAKPCNPPKPGYELDASGKCVKSPSNTTRQ